MELRNILVILGPPGSGKGTQGKMLAPTLNYAYVSMGQYLRNYASRGTELSQKIKDMIDKGRIIPDEWIRIIFHEVMSSLPENTTGVILDGFPRDLAQAPLFEEAVKAFGVQVVRVIFIDVPENKLRERLKLRGESGSNRADDNPEIFNTRFEQFRTKTHPLRDYFASQSRLIDVNGDQSIEDVHAEIVKKLGLKLSSRGRSPWRSLVQRLLPPYRARGRKNKYL